MKTHLLLLLILSLLVSCQPATTAEESNPQEESYLMLDGHKIHYKTEGEGKPLLFVHGGYLNLDMWDRQADFFTQKGFQVIRFSDLGHGLTEQADSSSLGYEIIDAVATKCTDQKLTLIGLSWGGMLCVDYALQYPDKVEKLVLVAPGLHGWEYFQDSVAAQNYAARQEAIKQNDTIRAAQLFQKNWVIGPRRDASNLKMKLLKQTQNMILHTFRNHWQEDWSRLSPTPAIDRLDEIKTPTLIFTGDQDAEDILMIGKKYDTDIPNSRLTHLGEIAHCINMETPNRFNKLLYQFVGLSGAGK